MSDEQRRRVFIEHLQAAISALDMRNAYRGPMAPDRAILTTLVEYLSGDSSAPEPRKPCSICGSTEHSHLHCYGPVHETKTPELIRLKLAKDVYDDGADHHPPGYIGHKGDVVYLHSIQTAVVSHHGTGHGFVVHDGELEIPSAVETSARCTCGTKTALHEFGCGFRRDGDDGKGAVKAKANGCICRPVGGGDGDTVVVNPRCQAHGICRYCGKDPCRCHGNK